jgi:NADH:ubiquinone oxidoreductase subunit F (NADH-binding)/NAD-dependent dihydropyrimidine dehydrogenase PreA subunit/(2Fe-2S) ferredoxin
MAEMHASAGMAWRSRLVGKTSAMSERPPFLVLQEEARGMWRRLEAGTAPRVIIGMGTCGIAAGAAQIQEVVHRCLAEHRFDASLESVGCIGTCYAEPLLDVVMPGQPRVSYGSVTPDVARWVMIDHVMGGSPLPNLAMAVIGDEAVDGIPSFEDLPVMKGQRRIALRHCGLIDPTSLHHYVANDGYAALYRALWEMTGEEVIDEMKRSGMRGRGGAGFSTGMKWELCRRVDGSPKYMVCNADEGDPGAFMDRSVLEGDPHTVLEGMAIAAYAIGASMGYVYARAEYPLAIKRLRKAIAQAEEYGLLGDRIMGSGFSFHVTIKEGAGAFVCGEETALIASIEGKRGMPRQRPPFPAQSGLWGKPTTINNVETLASVPEIIRRGPEWYAGIGTTKSKGTKTFALAGKITRPGLIEVPLGITLREVVFDIGGGIVDGKPFKAAQTGGPSGGCIPASALDLPMDYENLASVGSIMGSGGLVVMDEDTCMVDVARFFLSFTQNESCGKCVPCRLGTKQMLDILVRITEGKGELEDLEKLQELGDVVRAGSLCALGGTAPNPVMSTLRYFRDEYESHVVDKRCPARDCRALLRFTIDPLRCTGCMVCARNCPVGAISGAKKEPHSIDTEKCTKCGACFDLCKFAAVVKS